MDMTEIEFFVMVNADGEYVVHREESELGDQWDSDIGGSAPINTRTYAIKLAVPVPKVIEVSATLPNTDGPVTVTVA